MIHVKKKEVKNLGHLSVFAFVCFSAMSWVPKYVCCVFQRAKTLLVELKESGKSNSFKDQRLGEKNPSLSVDDKVIQRFALERKVSDQWGCTWMCSPTP